MRLKNGRIEYDGRRKQYNWNIGLKKAWTKPSITSKWRFLSAVFKKRQKALHCSGPRKAPCRTLRMIEYLRYYYPQVGLENLIKVMVLQKFSSSCLEMHMKWWTGDVTILESGLLRWKHITLSPIAWRRKGE